MASTLTLTITPADTYIAAGNEIEFSFTDADIVAQTGTPATLDITDTDIVNIQDGSTININGTSATFGVANDFAANIIGIGAILQNINDWIESNYTLSTRERLTVTVTATTLTIVGYSSESSIVVQLEQLSTGGRLNKSAQPTQFKLRENYAVEGRIASSAVGLNSSEFKMWPISLLDDSKTNLDSYTIKKEMSRIVKSYMNVPLLR